MFYTTGCATILSLIVYGVVGFTLPASSISSPELVSQMLGTLESMFHFNLLLLLPAVIVLLGAFLRQADRTGDALRVGAVHHHGLRFPGLPV